ncbi:uncharacterized protein LOC126662028 [Mercurialis annua]|uniref:uncharacterized protein LOC126662028 n=1 Tax=Mercurialis annua TaxID=3986 RepID=UPI00215DECC0|nr:uncharacterized protein LOC126662028 [Mercurialis annua]
MSNCLSSAFTSVLVNGNPIEPFVLKRGVRQGDPISPYLFVLAAEGLKSILQKAKEKGLINGFAFSDDHDPISVLQFADDTVLFLPYDLQQLRNLTRILRCFELISGLKINFHKSSLLGINVSESELSLASRVVGCRVEKFPIRYLGLPLAVCRTPVSTWNHVIQRFKSKLSLWKGNLLSPAGRLVLLKSVLYSLPIYFMSIIGMPVCVQNQIETYMQKFLWKGDSSSTRVLCRISWNIVCKDFEVGGLGVCNLRIRNQSLLLKWLWKLRTSNRDSLWFSVISACSSLTNWNSLLHGDTMQLSFIWKGIRRLCCLDEKVWDLFISNLRFNIGNGESISLWHDNWSGIGTAASLYPRLYNLSNIKQATISSVLAGGWRWRRRLRLGENDQFSELQLLLQQVCNGFTAGNDCEDVLVWKPNSHGFTAASMASIIRLAAAETDNLNQQTVTAGRRSSAAASVRQILTDTRGITAATGSIDDDQQVSTVVQGIRVAAGSTKIKSSAATFKLIWKCEAPPRVIFFMWTALHYSTPTLSFLASRKIILDSNMGCDICGEVETQNHIFLHRIFARKIWYELLHLMGISWVMPSSFEDFFLQWIAIVPNRGVSKLWTTIWIIFVWEIWKCRNLRVFQHKDSSTMDVIFKSFNSAAFYYKSDLQVFHGKDQLVFPMEDEQISSSMGKTAGLPHGRPATDSLGSGYIVGIHPDLSSSTLGR